MPLVVLRNQRPQYRGPSKTTDRRTRQPGPGRNPGPPSDQPQHLPRLEPARRAHPAPPNTREPERLHPPPPPPPPQPTPYRFGSCLFLVVCASRPGRGTRVAGWWPGWAFGLCVLGLGWGGRPPNCGPRPCSLLSPRPPQGNAPSTPPAGGPNPSPSPTPCATTPRPHPRHPARRPSAPHPRRRSPLPQRPAAGRGPRGSIGRPAAPGRDSGPRTSC
jgi:hypothetical protein